MSGKFLARASALSLAFMLAACGGGDESTPIVNVDAGNGGMNGGSNTDSEPGDDTTTIDVALGKGSGSSFISGQLTASTTNLSPGGQSLITVSAVDAANNNKLVSGKEVNITFSSSCLDQESASLSENPVKITAGKAETTYTAKGCSGDDPLTATAEGSEASIVLNVDAAAAVTLTALPPTPNSIAPSDISGNSQEGRPSSSTVKFQLIDKDENGVENAKLSFELFPPNSKSIITPAAEVSTHGPGGVFTTTVEAGPKNEIVRVIATATTPEGETITTTSAPIAINSYIPTDANFSMSIDNYMPDAWGADNVSIGINIAAADRYGTGVRGNTIVNFTTSNGRITPPDCELNDQGTCGVTWNSLSPKEARPRITAYTQGETKISGTDCDLPTSNCDYKFSTLTESTTIVQSYSDNTQVDLTLKSGNTYCATTYTTVFDAEDGNTQIPPPAGTSVKFETDAGKILNESQASKTIGTGSALVMATEYSTCVDAEADTSSSEPSRLRVIVTPPGADPVEDFAAL